VPALRTTPAPHFAPAPCFVPALRTTPAPHFAPALRTARRSPRLEDTGLPTGATVYRVGARRPKRWAAAAALRDRGLASPPQGVRVCLQGCPAAVFAVDG